MYRKPYALTENFSLQSFECNARMELQEHDVRSALICR